ncbi:helix-turn-helix domain-containing protein [Fluviicola chungangensis]|uniref:Helix-turn-helix domain-containing protein n=2 Tax=Fluviicola chungangensis TaxID=2597671 RepID=A0A556MQ89_9FLAO|nr:helix-turn-helix domain-containing protein [Fluviicola chungangensis]
MDKIPLRRISDRIQNSDKLFSIRTLEEILDGKPMNDGLHRHNYFFILVIKTGTGEHVIDFIPYSIDDRSVFILRPGQIHQLKLAPDCKGFLMQFDADFYSPTNVSAKQRFRRVTAKNSCSPEPLRFEKLCAILDYIYQEYMNKERDFSDLIRANLDIFFIESMRQSANPAQKTTTEISYEQERFEEFQELLEKHVTEHKTVIQYAEMMGISVYQLNKVTKDVLEKTVSELIHEQLILESKRTLLGTSVQVKEVAYSLGFEDVSYFIRFFRKGTGFSPEAFRNHFR